MNRKASDYIQAGKGRLSKEKLLVLSLRLYITSTGASLIKAHGPKLVSDRSLDWDSFGMPNWLRMRP